MKKFLKKLGRFIFFLSYIFFVAVLVVVTSILIIKNNEYLKFTESYNKLNQDLTQLQQQSNSLDQSREITELNKQVTTLSTQNKELENKLKEIQQTQQSSISGKISGQIILGQDQLSNFQLVCAQNTKNKNEIYCESVSAITQEFQIYVPAGSYYITAKVLNKENQTFMDQYTGKYTEYVKCLTEKGSSNCDVTLSEKQIEIEVKKGANVVNANPVDWN